MDSNHSRKRYALKIKQTGPYNYQVAIPKFGKECVCCNSLLTEPVTARIGNSDQFQLSGPILMPVCPDCNFHVHWRSMFLDKVFGMGIGVCVIYAAVWAIFGQQMFPLSLAAAVFFPTLIYLLYTFIFSRRMGGPGHHSGIGIYLSTRTVHIHTSNRDLLDRLLRYNQASEIEMKVKPALPESKP